MAYLVCRRFFFVHVPKTGGKAFLDAFQRLGLTARPLRSFGYHVGHAPLDRVTDERYKLPEFRESLAVVRDPVDWYRSLWKYVETPSCGLFDLAEAIGHPFRPVFPWLRRGLPVSDFIGELCSRGGGFYSEMLERYTDGVGMICRTGNLGPAMVHAAKRWELPVGPAGLRYLADPRRVNVSKPAGAPDETVSGDVRRLVERVECVARDIVSRAGVYTESGELIQGGKR